MNTALIISHGNRHFRLLLWSVKLGEDDPPGGNLLFRHFGGEFIKKSLSLLIATLYREGEERPCAG